MTVMRLIYVSRNRLDGTEAERRAALDAILAAARAKNRAAGITGALMAGGGLFAQVLEGPAEAVEAVFETIQCDERHSEVTVLEAGVVAARSFGEWDMADCGPPPAGDAAFARLVLPDGGASAEEVLDLLRGVMHRAPVPA